MVKIGDIAVGEFHILLAPMEDVSDPPFRALCKEAGADVVYTEFISSEGLIRNAAKSVEKLDIYDEERPVGIQIFAVKSNPCGSVRVLWRLQNRDFGYQLWLPGQKSSLQRRRSRYFAGPSQDGGDDPGDCKFDPSACHG